MWMKKRKAGPSHIVVVGSVLLVSAGCPTAPSSGGGGSNNTDNGSSGGGSGSGNGSTGVPGTNVDRPARAASGLAGFFDAGEPWAIGSPSFLAFGIGDFIDFMSMSGNQANGMTCVAPTPAASIGFNDGTLSLTTEALTDATGLDCAMDMSVDATSCAPGSGMIGPPNPCFAPQAQGEVVVGGASNSPDSPRVVRLETCDAPSFLSSISEWAILSVHPFALPLIPDPSPYGAVVLIGGNGAVPTTMSLVTGSDSNDNPLGCIDESPTGSVTLLNDTLTVDLTIDGQDNSSGFGSPGSCTVQFSGSLTYCEIIDPSELGGSGAGIQLVRFDGVGEYQTADDGEEMNTMYFSFETGTGGGGLPGGVRVKTPGDSSSN